MPEPTASDSERLLTQRDVAQRLGRSVVWVRQQTAAGKIAHVDLGTEQRPAPRYRLQDVEAFELALLRPATSAPNPYGRRRRGSAA